MDPCFRAFPVYLYVTIYRSRTIVLAQSVFVLRNSLGGALLAVWNDAAPEGMRVPAQSAIVSVNGNAVLLCSAITAVPTGPT